MQSPGQQEESPAPEGKGIYTERQPEMRQALKRIGGEDGWTTWLPGAFSLVEKADVIQSIRVGDIQGNIILIKERCFHDESRLEEGLGGPASCPW